MHHPALWSPVKLGDLELPHRLAMSPMTRSRATPAGVPGELSATYYAQRASHALIVTEGTQPSEDGQGYLATPGIFTAAHVEGWRAVTDAVHSAGGAVFIQLMHVGRLGHPANTPHGRTLVAPSAVAAQAQIMTPSGLADAPAPRALTESEIAQTVEDFAHAAVCAVRAGADGVEIHGGYGYLLHQFLAPNVNLRDDRYGGSVDNRIRFVVEVCAAVADAIGPSRTGLRISPGSGTSGISEPDAHATYTALVAELARLDLAYLHFVHLGDEKLVRDVRQLWSRALVVNRPGADIGDRVADVTSGIADLVSAGALALANPDLPRRLQLGAPLNDPDPATFYGGGAQGYVDYPFLDQ